MRDSFRERLKKPNTTIIPEEDLIPENLAVSRLMFVKHYQESAHNFIDKMVHGDKILNKQKGARAKNLIDASMATILGDYGTDMAKKRLSDKDQQKILSMVKDLHAGNRAFLLFELNGSADGIIEKSTNTPFKFIE